MLKRSFLNLIIIPILCISLVLTPRGADAVLPLIGAAALSAAATALGAAFVYQGRQMYLKNGGQIFADGSIGDRIGKTVGELYYKYNAGEQFNRAAQHNSNAGIASVSSDYVYHMASSHGSDYPELHKLLTGPLLYLPSLPPFFTFNF